MYLVYRRYPIELKWQYLKKDELSGQIFDDELDLTDAVICGDNFQVAARRVVVAILSKTIDSAILICNIYYNERSI
jgi:hypothetical protein